MKIEHLKTLIALYNNNCDPGIHTKINLKRSTLWQHIDLLEQSLGVKLIERRKQQNSFTIEGLAFIPNAIKAVELLESTKTKIIHSQEIVKDILHLKICCTRATAETWIIESIKGINNLFPNLTLEIRAEDHMEEHFFSDFDILIRPKKGFKDFKEIWSLEYNFALFASEDYLDIYGYPETPDDLIHHTIIAYGHPDFTDLEDINWHLQGKKYDLPKLNPKIFINSTSSIFKAALLGMGICSVPTESSYIYGKHLTRVLPQLNGPSFSIKTMINNTAIMEEKKKKVLLIFLDHLKNFLLSKKGIKVTEEN